MGCVPRSASPGSRVAPSSSSPARPGRRRRLTASAAALAALAGYVTFVAVSGGEGALCTVTSAEGSTYEMTPEQASNAATISAVGTGRGLPERAVTIALATAMQESGLRNIRHGDRDSQGLFQQRPSQGWGTVAQITDPVYASGRFYEHLAEIPGYSRLPLTVAAQRVQRSGFPQAYAKHEPDAALLAASLTGRAPASLTCGAQRGKDEPGDAAKVRGELARAFGPETGGKPGKPGKPGKEARGAQGAGGAAARPDEVVVPVPAAASAAAGALRTARVRGAAGSWRTGRWRGRTRCGSPRCRTRAGSGARATRAAGARGGARRPRVPTPAAARAATSEFDSYRSSSGVRPFPRTGHRRVEVTTEFRADRERLRLRPSTPLRIKGSDGSSDFRAAVSLPGFIHA